MLFAKLCSVASAINLAGLPIWSASDGAAHYPIFLQSMGAFLTIQLGCAYFQVLNPTNLPSAFHESLVGMATAAEYTRVMTTAFAYLTMALHNNPEMFVWEINNHLNFRDAMIALYTYASGDSESEVMRGTLKMMELFLSRGHSDVSALTILKVLSALQGGNT
jgi:hypothetical protein